MLVYLARFSPQNIWRFFTDKFRSVYSFFFGRFLPRPAPVALPKIEFVASTANFFRVQPGLVLKSPTTIGGDGIPKLDPTVEALFDAEKRILEYLGPSPHVVEYLGWDYQSPTGLLFKEANNGSLQFFLDNNFDEITASQRQNLCQQAVECVAYIHSRGIIHNDLRADNFLVHDSKVLLCDFATSSCEGIGLEGLGFPRFGFCNPLRRWESSTTVDVFGLGSVLYITMTGYWPFRTSRERMFTMEELDEYEQISNTQFSEKQFPHVSDAHWDEVIQKCWTGAFSNGQEVAEFIKAC